MTPEEQAKADADAAAVKAKADADAKAKADADAAAAIASANSGNKAVIMERDRFNRRLREERAAGAKEALGQLDKIAQAAGFESHEDMVKKLAKKHAAGGDEDAPPPDEDEEEAARLEAQAAELRRKREQNRNGNRNNGNRNANNGGDHRAWAKEADRQRRTAEQASKDKVAAEAKLDRLEKEKQRAQKQLDDERLERKLVALAQASGVKANADDLEEALHMFRRHVRSIAGNEKALAAFDEEKFFGETLRERRPHLYGEKPAAPITTAPAGGAQAARAPASPAPPGASAQPTVIDLNMPRDKYEEMLRKRGFAVPGEGGVRSYPSA